MKTRHGTGARLIVMAMMLALALPVLAGAGEPPVAAQIAKIDTVFGIEMVDNYYWLRERDNPEVLAYLEAENAYTEEVMDHAKPLVDKLYGEIKGRIKETDLSVPVKDGDYYYYDREEEGKQYSIYCRKKGSIDADEEILLDVNMLAEGKEFMSIGTFEVSPDHTMLMYSTDERGSERYTLQFKNLTSGELLPDRIDETSGDAVWANDNSTVFYTVPDDAWRPYQLYRHTLGTDRSTDVLIYQEDDELYWMGVGKTKSDKYVIVHIGSKTTDEELYLDADNPTGEFRPIQRRVKGMEFSTSHHGDRFYIVTNADGATNFKLVSAPVSAPGKENWTDVFPYRANVKIDGIDVFQDWLVVYEREDGLQKMRVVNLNSNESHYIDFPESVYSMSTNSNPDYKTSVVRFTYMSMITPNSVFDYDMKTHQRELKKQREVLGGYDPTQYETKRVWATARDGARVPISMVCRKGIKQDGTSPLIMYGYGSYGISMDPWFSSSRLSLMDRGFIYTIAHIRGGGEMGRQWYEDGKFLKKNNTFNDFIDCAEFLIKEKYTSSDKLVIDGGSAGGLLIGAVVNMRPDLFGVALASVPFVDVMNTMLDETIPLTVVEYEEWGNPNEEKFFKYMLSYSPYDNVKKQAYPNMLIQSSLNDTRVQYWEGTKWAAKLRVNNTSSNRILLKTNMGAGHGGSSGRYDYLKDIAFEYAFVLDCLGITK